MKKIINVVVEAAKFIVMGDEVYSRYADESIMDEPILKF